MAILKKFSVLIPLFLFGVAAFFWIMKSDLSSFSQRSDRPLSPLAPLPQWEKLEAYQESITREDFEKLLTEIFTTGDLWKKFIEIDSEKALFSPGTADGIPFQLRFAKSADQLKAIHASWKKPSELPVLEDRSKPLSGVHIAIDPGHIGGSWAKMEERWLSFGGGNPVCEGDMTLLVAQLLKPRLEALGAKVSLVRERNEPVTSLRPPDLMSEVLLETKHPTPEEERKVSERLFYRTAEIRARAELVNTTIKPDLVVCLHFNASAWGDPTQPEQSEGSHNHILVNGGYTDDEVRFADQRFEMLLKLLQQTHRLESDLAKSLVQSFVSKTALPPYVYSPLLKNARNVDGDPYIYARNLLANRLYHCPVVFLEPYVMNSKIDFERMKAGDFEGKKVIAGAERISIFREYADAVEDGLKSYYETRRK